MAKTVALYSGGGQIFQFATGDSTRIFGCPMPAHVAGEYERGYFTLGMVLQPACIPYQRDAFAKLKLDTDMPVSVPLLVVPEKFLFKQLFLDVNPKAPVNANQNVGAGDSMQGVTFDVYAKLVDNTKAGDYETMAEFLDSGEDYTLPDGFTGIDANAYSVHQAMIPEGDVTETTTEVHSPVLFAQPDTLTSKGVKAFIPAGRSLVIGVKFLTKPTGHEGTLSAMRGRISLVAKVEDYECPVRK